MDIQQALIEQAERSAADPDGVEAHIATGDEAMARIAAPLVFAELFTGRRPGAIIDIRPCGPCAFDVVLIDLGPVRPA